MGPYMIGALKAKFQGYTVPMLFMTCVNSLAVVYFAILLPFLPAKIRKAQDAGAAASQASLVKRCAAPPGVPRALHLMCARVCNSQCVSVASIIMAGTCLTIATSQGRTA